jgi:hypothetical protein
VTPPAPDTYQTTLYNHVSNVTSAADIAGHFLAVKLPQRWEHTKAVAAKADELARSLDIPDHDKALLVVSAWYHDIGYALATPAYHWHPLDGAILLRGWELDLVASQVAWHTTAQEEALLLGMMPLLLEYPKPEGLVADALTYADMTTGPDGTRVTFEQRLAEVRIRRGPGSSQVLAMERAWPRLLETRTRVDAAIHADPTTTLDTTTPGDAHA